MVILAGLTDRNALIGLLIIFILPVLLYLVLQKLKFRNQQKLTVTLEKSRLYRPEFLTLTVVNDGKKPVEIGHPRLVFSNFLIRRKLKLKGINGYQFYPLWLDPGEKHELHIELSQFYFYDPILKKYPKVSVYVQDNQNGATFSHRVMLRKTLFT